MQTYEAICQRASIRKYQEKSIDKDILSRLVDAGRRAPTARKVEPWEFIVITDKSVLNILGEKAVNGSFVRDASACIAIFCHETKYYLEDGCAATQNILLMAADLGLGACWIAGDKKDYAGEIQKMLEVPEGYKLVSMIALGYPVGETCQNKGRSLESVLHWEQYKNNKNA